MGPDDFHDLGLCPECEADLTIDEEHDPQCPLLLEHLAREEATP